MGRNKNWNLLLAQHLMGMSASRRWLMLWFVYTGAHTHLGCQPQWVMLLDRLLGYWTKKILHFLWKSDEFIITVSCHLVDWTALMHLKVMHWCFQLIRFTFYFHAIITLLLIVQKHLASYTILMINYSDGDLLPEMLQTIYIKTCILFTRLSISN